MKCCGMGFLASGVPVPHQRPALDMGLAGRAGRAGSDGAGRGGEAAGAGKFGDLSAVLPGEDHPSRGGVYKNFPAC